MKRTAIGLILTLALLVSTIAGAKLVNWAGANPYHYTNSSSSFVTVSTLTPENKTYDTNNIQVTIIAEAYPGVWYVEYSVDGGPLKEVAPGHALGHTFNESVWLNRLSKGSHNIIVQASAMANNPEGKITAYSQVYFTVAKEIQPHDYAAPAITIVSPRNETYRKIGIPLNFTVDEPDCWIRYKIDAQDEIEVSRNTTLTGFYYGSHNLTVYATDAAGNTGIQTVVFTSAEPEETNLPPEAFPTTFIVAASGVSIAVLGVGLLVYLKKRNHKWRL